MSPRYCDHNFQCIKHMLPPDIPAIVVCVYCGQVRHLHADGRVLIIIETGEVKKAYGNTITNKTQS